MCGKVFLYINHARMKKNNIYFSVVGFVVAVFGVFGVIQFALATDSSYGLETAASAAELNKGDVPTIIGNIVGTALSLISVIFFILMLYGGILWMTARGNDDQAKKAQDTIFAAIIGIIVVLAAYAITSFVFSSIGGVASSGGGGGSGGAGTTQTCEQKHPGWACLDATAGQCASASSRDTCTEGNNCEINLCPGTGPTVVCCEPAGGTTPAPPCSAPSFCTGSQVQEFCTCVSTLEDDGTGDVQIACAGAKCTIPTACDELEEINSYSTCMFWENENCEDECTP